MLCWPDAVVLVVVVGVGPKYANAMVVCKRIPTIKIVAKIFFFIVTVLYCDYNKCIGFTAALRRELSSIYN